jgi:hypothetical protein
VYNAESQDYLIRYVRYFTDRLTWRQVAQRSPLCMFSVIRGPRVLFQCITVTILFLLPILEEDSGKGFIRLADTHYYIFIFT